VNVRVPVPEVVVADSQDAPIATVQVQFEGAETVSVPDPPDEPKPT
jgi:hypothetical protein